MGSSGLGVKQSRQVGPFTTFLNYLPGTMPVNSEDNAFRFVPFDEVGKYLKGIAIKRQGSHPAKFFLLSDYLFDADAADWAEFMEPGQHGSVIWTREFQAGLKMLDGNRALDKIDIAPREGFLQGAGFKMPSNNVTITRIKLFGSPNHVWTAKPDFSDW